MTQCYTQHSRIPACSKVRAANDKLDDIATCFLKSGLTSTRGVAHVISKYPFLHHECRWPLGTSYCRGDLGHSTTHWEPSQSVLSSVFYEATFELIHTSGFCKTTARR